MWLLGHSEYKCGHCTLCPIRRRSDEFLVSCIFPAVKYVVALCRGVFGSAPTFHSLPSDGTPSWTADVAHDAFFFYLDLQSCRKTSAHCPPRLGLDESIEVGPVYFWDGQATLEKPSSLSSEFTGSKWFSLHLRNEDFSVCCVV